MNIIFILISFISGFMLGKHIRFRSKNYGVTKKMFLTLERNEIDRKIEVALELEDYGTAMVLHRKRDRLERKLNKINRKQKNKDDR